MAFTAEEIRSLRWVRTDADRRTACANTIIRSTQQFANVDTPFLGWDFVLQDEQGGPIGTVNRNFSGFAREVSKAKVFHGEYMCS